MSHFKTILIAEVVEETGFADLRFFRTLCTRSAAASIELFSLGVTAEALRTTIG